MDHKLNEIYLLREVIKRLLRVPEIDARDSTLNEDTKSIIEEAEAALEETSYIDNIFT